MRRSPSPLAFNYLLLPLLSFGASELYAAKFQMLKKGEWNMELVESSLGPLGDAIKAKPFCVDEKTAAGGWEERAKQAMSKAGLDCQLKTLKEEASLISFQTDCKTAAGQKPTNPLLTADSKFSGEVTVTRISENEYRLDQNAVGSGLKLGEKDLGKVPEGQRKMLESMLGIQDGKMKLSMKQKYTYSKPTCST